MEIQELLTLSVKQGASDMHLLPEDSPLIRVHGELMPMADQGSISAEEAKRLIYSFLSQEQQRLFEKNKVLDLAIAVPQVASFRVSVFHQRRGVVGVFRVIPEKTPTVDELALPPALRSLLVLSHGLILVVGPTGSGKSTTLAAMIDYINNFRACNIITIEDPVEFVHQNKKSNFNQIQIGLDTPDFATALRATQRQDADVILLGEMRDLETIRLALNVAETGHLVMSTLHASSAPLAISRIVDVFPSEEKNRVRTMLSETLRVVVYQTLVKKVGGGRVAAFEMMTATPAIRHYIRRDMVTHMDSAIQTGGDKGMCSLEQYLDELAEKGIITKATVNQVLTARGIFKEPQGGGSKR